MSKLRTCPACNFYARGGKSRIAMKHTCGKEPQVKSFKLPKVKPDGLFEVVVQRTGMIETKNALIVHCQKQVIEGVTIPQGFEICLPNQNEGCIKNSYSSRPIALVDGWKLNQILKLIVMEGLRNG